MAQGIVAGELLIGAAKVRLAPVGTDDLAIIAAADPDWTGWTYQGLTDGGVNASLQKSYANHTVDQSPDWVASTITERHASIATTLAAFTLDKLKAANNGGTIVTGVGTTGAWDSWEPITDVIETPEEYTALALVVVRRTLSVENMDFAFTKEAKTTLGVSWAGHFVSDETAPVVVYTQR
jgi:hypothetical protein